MRHLYTAIFYLLLPLVVLRLLWRSRHTPAYRQRITERLGRGLSDHASAADVWLHAVSVGEVQAAQPLIRHLLNHRPPLTLLVTTTTPTGAQRLTELFGQRVQHHYLPFDLPAAQRRFLAQVKPRLVLVMETEIWPNLLHTCAAHRIPVVLVNARLSARSAHGYARLGAFTRTTLQQFDLIAAQTAADAARFVQLGADAAQVAVIGNLKFDQNVPGSLQDRAEALRRVWGTNRPVWVAASTHEGEEAAILAAHQLILRQHPSALLILVPRHPERFERVANLVTRAELTLARRSANQPCTAAEAVYLGDTMGELPALLAAADAAFIGGSWVNVGGHNPLEAAAVGVPVTFGPNMFNFQAVAQLLLAEQAAVQVTTAAALADCLTQWLGDAAQRSAIGERGRRVVVDNRGAAGRLFELLAPYLFNITGCNAR
ncbi:lipid IV(A) 3-deoxy-D-manno-octulosonic acid transferase [Rhodoferax sp. 4810]|uniref:3-deoxy-D-manno-octulosonic acid transferase n=2 Tax=Thiospirillum jenense TaxID=1653858 RepID=A0A839HJ04_9GAMM|nr:lipid IV(A) 3-deoxy-D-manno-octulosonic acid transferase [Rhodoferax jenense]MBB1126838.1 lipid IV(A) 3-deoxy-D-manno-octulosonic acid transferase [Thiospirillum jenense]